MRYKGQLELKLAARFEVKIPASFSHCPTNIPMPRHLLLSLMAGLAISAASLPAARQVEVNDWKIALGWNGTFTPPSKIGVNTVDGLVLYRDLAALMCTECNSFTIGPGRIFWGSVLLPGRTMADELRIRGVSMLHLYRAPSRVVSDDLEYEP